MMVHERDAKTRPLRQQRRTDGGKRSEQAVCYMPEGSKLLSDLWYRQAQV